MDDLKVFSKSEEQIDTLVRTVHVFSTDTEMDFGMWNSYYKKRERS